MNSTYFRKLSSTSVGPWLHSRHPGLVDSSIWRGPRGLVVEVRAVQVPQSSANPWKCVRIPGQFCTLSASDCHGGFNRPGNPVQFCKFYIAQNRRSGVFQLFKYSHDPTIGHLNTGKPDILMSIFQMVKFTWPSEQHENVRILVWCSNTGPVF